MQMDIRPTTALVTWLGLGLGLGLGLALALGLGLGLGLGPTIAMVTSGSKVVTA